LIKRKQKYLKLKKIATLGVILTSLLSLIFAAITIYANNVGFYVIELGDLSRNISLCESEDFENPTDTIYVKAMKDMTNIDGNDIDNNLIHSTDGNSNNGIRYIAHTFYLKNVSTITIDYKYEVFLTEVTKNLDSALRYRIIKDGEVITYAKAREEGEIGNPEPTSDEVFYSDDVIINEKVYEMKSGEIHKYSIIIYLEGNDPQCTDELLGGLIKMNMKFTII
jgi:hypothetical protein